MYTRLYALAMITTLMPHLRIGPYKEGVIIDQIHVPFHAVGRSFPNELLVLLIAYSIQIYVLAYSIQIYVLAYSIQIYALAYSILYIYFFYFFLDEQILIAIVQYKNKI